MEVGPRRLLAWAGPPVRDGGRGAERLPVTGHVWESPEIGAWEVSGSSCLSSMASLISSVLKTQQGELTWYFSANPPDRPRLEDF